MNYDHDYENIFFNDSKVPFSYGRNCVIREEAIPALRIPRWHEQMEFKLILSGCGEISCGSTLFHAHAGDIVVIHSCELHSITPVELSNGEELRYHILILSPNLLYSDRLGTSISEEKVRFRNHIRDNARCRELLSALFDELSEKRPSYELAATGYISLFFAELLRSERVTDLSAPRFDDLSRYGEKLEPAFRMIGEQYGEELNLDRLAAACGKSVYHFSRLFRQVTGQTVVEYLNEYRISKAELLLTSTELPIGEIAAAVGFPDKSYFSRYFKKIKGITPSECRAGQRESAK